jgi:hypothetical protein
MALMVCSRGPSRGAGPRREMILHPATTEKRADVVEATRQILVALQFENWWKHGRR